MEDAATARRNAIATIDFERPMDEFLRTYLSPVPDEVELALAELTSIVVEDVGRTVGGVGHLPHGAVGSGPGGDPVGCHRQRPATLVHQVMVVLTER